MSALPPHHEPVSFADVLPSDFEALVALRIEAMRESLERIGRFDAIRARERFRAGFSPEHTRHIVVDGKPIGFVVVKPQDDGLLIDHLYVQPGSQGQGIGAAVLAHVFAEADARALPVRVGVLRDSDSNRFYARHGFLLIERGEFDNYYIRQPKIPSMSDPEVSMQSYYAARAPEYDRVYEKPERQADLRHLQQWLPPIFAGSRLFEVACGTGFWTQFIAPVAAEVVALDASAETLAIAECRLPKVISANIHTIKRDE